MRALSEQQRAALDHGRPARKVDPDRLREWHAAGMCDRDAADRFGATVSAVFQARRALGLPPNPSPHKRAASARNARSLAKRCPLRLAERYGLPAGTPDREVGVLVALAAGPRTRAEVAAATGVRAGSGRSGYLANVLYRLMRKGWVAAARSGPGRTAARAYLLTPAAMDLLTNPAEARRG